MLSIIIPCYNEAANLPFLASKIAPLFDKLPDLEIILVDNGSTDNSAEILENLSTTVPFRIVSVPVNRGYGHGILCGLDAASGDVLSWTHADLQTDPEDVLKAYALYQQSSPPYLLIKGRRRNRRLLEKIFTFGMQCYVNGVLKTNLSDINAQPKLFSRIFFEEIRSAAPKDFSLDLYVLYEMSRLGSIKTVDVFFNKRSAGESKGGGTWIGRLKLIKRTFDYVNNFKKNKEQL